MAKLKIGIVGCGAIGSSLAKVMVRDFAEQTELAALYDIDILKAKKLSKTVCKNKDLPVNNLDQLINKSELVIECACARSSWSIAQSVLKNGRDILIMSVGGIVEHYQELKVLAEKKNVNIFIPSGAICGMDGLKAAHCGKINKVTLTTKKPPKAFLGVPYVLKKGIHLDNINEDTVLFEGDALTAIKAFPQNINVAATLSLAGIGLENTTVRIVASPNITRNIHEIEIESEAGKVTTRTENVIHPDNPKSSYLAVLSAVATLKQILEPIRIGT